MPVEIGAILATIRAMESGGDYTVQVTTSTASGAYGFLDSSWGGYGGYWRARDAPPSGPGRQGRRAGAVDPRPQRRRRRHDPGVVVHRPRADAAPSGTACRRTRATG